MISVGNTYLHNSSKEDNISIEPHSRPGHSMTHMLEDESRLWVVFLSEATLSVQDAECGGASIQGSLWAI